MKSIQHVLWRGALALCLMAVGVGSGLGMSPNEDSVSGGECTRETRTLVADDTSGHARDQAITLIVPRRPLIPAG